MNDYYDYLLKQITPDLERKIMEIMIDHIGRDNRIGRDNLARLAVYGAGSFAHLSDTDDRKVRLAIASLQEKGYPILSDSGEGGYWLGRPDEIEDYIAELESRRGRLAEKIRALRKADKFSWVDRPMQPEQGRLF